MATLYESPLVDCKAESLFCKYNLINLLELDCFILYVSYTITTKIIYSLSKLLNIAKEVTAIRPRSLFFREQRERFLSERANSQPMGHMCSQFMIRVMLIIGKGYKK